MLYLKKIREVIYPIFQLYVQFWTLFHKIKTCFAFIRVNTSNRRARFENAWLFMDRPFCANDNAEHLYRFVQGHHPTIKTFFILKDNVPDWGRLKKDNFNLISYGVEEHREALRFCSVLISSQADKCIVNTFGEHTDWSKKFVFLQHGVTMNNLSAWLNFKKISLLVTSVRQEHDAFLDDSYGYRINKSAVRLLGMPRHDRLIMLPKDKKSIILAPTWRYWLSGANPHGDNFFKCWNELLSSPRLLSLAQIYGQAVVFLVHPQLLKYLHCFSISEKIDVVTFGNCDIQKEISKSSVLITDYSSLSFDFGIIQKPVIYFQFDRKKVFTDGRHTFDRGWFSYKDNGFGPVATDLTNCLDCLNEVLRSITKGDDKTSKEIYKRLTEMYRYYDPHNCQRVFEAIYQLASCGQSEQELSKKQI